FDHHDAVFAAGGDEVEFADLALRERRVDDEVALDEADADARNRLLEGNLGERQRGRRAGDGHDIGVVLAVSGQDEGDDLGLVAPAFGEERPDRSIDDATGQHFLFRRFAFALEETTRDAPGRVRVFAV